MPLADTLRFSGNGMLPLPWAGALFTWSLVAAWLVLFALLAREALRRDSFRWWPPCVGLFLFAAILRWTLCTGGPGDLRLNLRSIYLPEIDTQHGQAPIALFRFLALLMGGIRDDGIVQCNILLGSLVPVLLYLCVARLGVDWRAALAGAFITAAHPWAILFSGVLNRQATYQFAAFASVLALVVYIENRKLRFALACAMASVLAILSRPEGAHVLVVDIAVIVLSRMPAGRKVGLVATLVACGLLANLSMPASATGMRSYHWRLMPDQNIFTALAIVKANYTPLAWVLMWTGGILLRLKSRPAGMAVAILYALAVVWMGTGVSGSFVGFDTQIASSRYETILLFPFTIGIALFVERVLELRAPMKLAAFVAIGLASAATYERPAGTLLPPFTVDYEYRFLKRHLQTLPSGSTIYVTTDDRDVGFMGAVDEGLFVQGPSRTAEARFGAPCQPDPARGNEVYLYIGSNCADHRPSPLRTYSGAQARAERCRKLRERLVGLAVEEIDVPARPMSYWEFEEDLVRIGLYRMPTEPPCELMDIVRDSS